MNITKEQIEKLISDKITEYEFELPRDEYSVVADELSQEIVKLFSMHFVSESYNPLDKPKPATKKEDTKAPPSPRGNSR